MKDGNHSKRPSAVRDWMVLVLIALVTFGLSVAVTAYFLPINLPAQPHPLIHP